MTDLIYVLVLVAFFGLCIAYAAAFERM